MRIALGLEYDGSQYHGWQRQPNLRTVQGEVEKALAKIVGKETNVHCAGRTDTGVHAAAQVLHFECDVNRSLRAFVFGVNSQLPKDISIKWSKEVPEDFEARFAATKRKYRYIIYNHSIRPALLRSQLTWYYRPLNADLMAEGAVALVGEHDFSSFRSTECQSKTAIRKIESVSIKREGEFIIIDIVANAFLHHMVRNIAGVLMTIGSEKKPSAWTAELLEVKNRALGAETAPPYGLYLTEVTYPDKFQLPENIISNPLLLL
jgi:tRNA pseudouridine38-40 synthase